MRALPAPSIALKRSTSHAGRNAGGDDARTARERLAKPPAGTTLAPPSDRIRISPSDERAGMLCNWNGDGCQGAVPLIETTIIAADKQREITFYSRTPVTTK